MILPISFFFFFFSFSSLSKMCQLYYFAFLAFLFLRCDAPALPFAAFALVCFLLRLQCFLLLLLRYDFILSFKIDELDDCAGIVVSQKASISASVISVNGCLFLYFIRLSSGKLGLVASFIFVMPALFSAFSMSLRILIIIIFRVIKIVIFIIVTIVFVCLVATSGVYAAVAVHMEHKYPS